MPPKKSAATKAQPKKQDPPADVHDDDKMDVDSQTSKKRKSPPTDSKTESNKKAPRQGARSSSRATTASGGEPSARQVVNFLLSADSIPYCYPEDELSAAKSGDFEKTYSMTPPSSFTPFEHLVIAHLLSKPLNHTLGMRSIRTLLNPPYAFSTPQKMKEAGEKRVWEGLEDARTQHRQKTAANLAEMAEAYCDDETMFKLAEEVNDDGASGVVSHVKATVKGLGPTGAEIFCRRIQCVDGWGEAVWPFADGRCLDALRELGVKVRNADELQEFIEQEADWDKVGQMGLDRLVGTGREKDDGKIEAMDYEQRIQVEYVVLLERAVGCILEGKAGELRKAAKNWK